VPNIRVAGLLGKHPVKPPAERLPIKYLSAYLREPLPAASYPVDVTGGIEDDEWGMCANGPDPSCTSHPNGLGDCSFAGREHYQMAKAACNGEHETPEPSNELAAEYLAYDHGQDVGANLADLLLFWYRTGRILGFAPVDHTSKAEADAAMQAFHGLYVGVGLTDDAQQLFADGQPWTVAGGQQSNPQLGHCILKVRANGRGRDGYATWGQVQDATEDWSEECTEETWVILTREDGRVNLAALRADIDALGGYDTPAPAPAPAPAPVNHEGLLHELAGKVRDVARSADNDVTGLLAWLHVHGL